MPDAVPHSEQSGGASAVPLQGEASSREASSTEAPSAQHASAAPPGQEPAAGSSFALGWLMADLFGVAQGDDRATQPVAAPHLPAVAELDLVGRMDLALASLDKLLGARKGLADELKKTWNAAGHAGYADATTELHLSNLTEFATDPQQLSAYQLGVALNGVCWLPDTPPGQQTPAAEATAVVARFSRGALACLLTWLAEAGTALAPGPAATVSRSLQNWQDWADVNAPKLTSDWNRARPAVAGALRTQAAVWHALLAGQTDTTGQTSVDAWVQAGESILRTTWSLAVRVLRRFWPAVLVVLAATAGLLYVANANTSGTSSFWANVVTVAAALGLSGASLRAAARRAITGIEHDLSRAAILDAQAWAATWLPALPQGLMQRSRLSRRGVAAPQAKPQLESAVSALGERPDHQPGPRLGAE